MRQTQITTIVTFGLLAAAAGVSFLLPQQLSPTGAGAMPVPRGSDELPLDGVVRDFLSTHADFNTTASGGNGHYAGNVALGLNANQRPAFSGGGFKVNTQWKDRDLDPIAPHLYTAPGQVRLASAPAVDKDAFFDTWDSSVGAYSPLNSGPTPSVSTAGLMPTITAPTNLGPSIGNAFYQNTVTLSTDVHCDNFDTRRDTILSISGARTILCEGNFVTGQRTQILILPNSSLRLYVKGSIDINQTSEVNMNTWQPSRVRIYNLGTSSVDINQSNQVCAIIVSPNAPMHLHQDDHFYGTFIGKGLQMDKTTGFHSDTRPVLDSCGTEIVDTAGTAGAASTGGITSAATFAQWFSDALGVNASMPLTLMLTLGAGGVYEYQSKAFHPIDGLLLGNEGASHNHYFTFSASTTFTHRACDERFFEFSGADDAWLFIDGQLVIDRGGLVPSSPQRITMDRLDLVDGETYQLDFFYAQRQPNVAEFSIRTNLELARRTQPYTVSASVD